MSATTPSLVKLSKSQQILLKRPGWIAPPCWIWSASSAVLKGDSHGDVPAEFREIGSGPRTDATVVLPDAQRCQPSPADSA